MGFIGMFFAGIFLIGAIIGFIFLVIGIILDIVCIVKKKKQEKSNKILVVFAVIFNIIGVLLFVLPVGGIIFVSKMSVWKGEQRLENAQYKVYVDDNEWRNGFEYKGMNLVSLDFVQAPKKEMLTEEGVVIRENGGEPLYISYVDNEGGFEIYDIERITDSTYCDSKQYEDIYEYYHRPENLEKSIEKLEDEWVELGIDYDPSIVFKIREVYDNHKDGLVYGNTDDANGRYVLVVQSKDRLFYESVWIVKWDGRYALESSSTGESFSAYVLPKEIDEYLKTILE